MFELKEINVGSERSLNLALSLVKKAPNKEITFPHTTTFKNGLKTVQYTGYWDETCFQIIDIFINYFACSFYEKFIGNIPKDPYVKELINEAMIYPSNDDEKNSKILSRYNFSWNISERQFRAYKQFKSITTKKFRDSLKKINNCKFTFDYGVRFWNPNKNKYKIIYIPITNESICNIKFINNTLSMDKKRILDVEYKIQFNSQLGSLILYNATMMNLDWINNQSFYKLSPKAQLFYRRLILPNRNEKSKYYHSDLNKKINFSNKRDLYLKDVKKCLKELESYKLIESYNFTKFFIEFVLNQNS